MDLIERQPIKIALHTQKGTSPGREKDRIPSRSRGRQRGSGSTTASISKGALNQQEKHTHTLNRNRIRHRASSSGTRPELVSVSTAFHTTKQQTSHLYFSSFTLDVSHTTRRLACYPYGNTAEKYWGGGRKPSCFFPPTHTFFKRCCVLRGSRGRAYTTCLKWIEGGLLGWPVSRTCLN